MLIYSPLLLGSGIRIIITTRNEHLLKVFEIDGVCKETSFSFLKTLLNIFIDAKVTFFQKLDTRIMEGSSPTVSLSFGADHVFENFHSMPFYLTFSTVCTVPRLCLGKSFQLFIRHAFRKDKPP